MEPAVSICCDFYKLVANSNFDLPVFVFSTVTLVGQLFQHVVLFK